MPQRKTAKTELRKAAKNKQRNKIVRGQIKASIKKFKRSLDGDQAKSSELLSETYKALDKAASKKVIHARKAGRQKSRLTKLLNKKP